MIYSCYVLSRALGEFSLMRTLQCRPNSSGSGKPISIANFGLFGNRVTNQSMSSINFKILVKLVDCAPNMLAAV